MQQFPYVLSPFGEALTNFLILFMYATLLFLEGITFKLMTLQSQYQYMGNDVNPWLPGCH